MNRASKNKPRSNSASAKGAKAPFSAQGAENAKSTLGTAILESIKRSKSSIIVLAIAALMFVAAMFYLYAEDVMEGIDDIHNPYSNEFVEFEKATVTDIVNLVDSMDVV